MSCQGVWVWGEATTCIKNVVVYKCNKNHMFSFEVRQKCLAKCPGPFAMCPTRRLESWSLPRAFPEGVAKERTRVGRKVCLQAFDACKVPGEQGLGSRGFLAFLPLGGGGQDFAE